MIDLRVHKMAGCKKKPVLCLVVFAYSVFSVGTGCVQGVMGLE